MRVVRFGLAVSLGILPTVVAAQFRVPTTSAELATADRSAWVAAFAAGCDTLSVDGTWQDHPVPVHTWPAQQPPRTRGMVRLPPVFAERGDVFPSWIDDVVPGFPPRDYLIRQWDPITTRLIFRSATVTVRCTDALRSAGPSVEGIWVAGYDTRGRGVGEYMIWYVFGSFRERERDRQWLFGMSRDLWGARTLVTAMRRAVFFEADSTPR